MVHFAPILETKSHEFRFTLINNSNNEITFTNIATLLFAQFSADSAALHVIFIMILLNFKVSKLIIVIKYSPLLI